MGDSTWKWKSTTKVDGINAQHEGTSIPRKMNQLRATKIPLDKSSTQLLCKATFKSRNWLDNIPHVGALSGWDREGKMLVWVDNGNSWTPLNQKGHMPGAARVLDEYRQTAMLMREEVPEDLSVCEECNGMEEAEALELAYSKLVANIHQQYRDQMAGS